MTEPRKTPRTDAAAFPAINPVPASCDEVVRAHFARALEIETQELAEAPRGCIDSPESILSPKLYDKMSAALARHRANQQPAP